MLSVINYAIKQIFEPFYLPCHLHRQVENDLPTEQDSLAQRAYKVTIPLLMLYQPLAKPLSIGMGALRVATHLDERNQARQKGQNWKFKAETALTGLATISLASSYLCLPVGIFLTTFADMVINLGKMVYYRREQNFDRFTEELLQLTGSSFYMAFMLSSSSYILLSSIVVHSLINLYHSRKAWKEGKTPEAFTLFIVASVRCFEAKQKWNVIQQQKAFHAQQEAEGQEILKKLNKLKAEIEAQNKLKAIQASSELLEMGPGRETLPQTFKIQATGNSGAYNVNLEFQGVSKSSLQQGAPRKMLKLLIGAVKTVKGDESLDPKLQQLDNLLNNSQIKKGLLSFPIQDFQNLSVQAPISEDAESMHDFGTNMHGYGRSLVKGFNLCFREKTLGGEEMVELDFKVNHVFRETMQKNITRLSDKETCLNMNQLSTLTDSSVKNITVTEGTFEMGGFANQKAYHLDFEGAGSILVGSNPEVAGMYNRVFVHIPKKCTLFQLHEILSFAGLENVLKRSTPLDLERLKIGHLFHHYYPAQATLFERTPQFFKFSINQLKTTVVEQVPEMENLFVQYLPKFRPYEILPGRIRYGIEGIGSTCYELGARSLIASMGIRADIKDFCNRVVSIIQTGMLSSELRLGNEINSVGMSPNSDLRHGSADNVFTQLVTTNDYQDNEAPAMGKFGYFNPDDSIAFEFDLDVLDTLTYQYHTDEYGTRNLVSHASTYLGRPNVYDFVTEEVSGYYRGHEVMIRDRIPPSFIRGILVANNEFKEYLYQHLRENGLIQSNQEGIETILDIPVSQFIRAPSGINMDETDYPTFRQQRISSL